MILKRSLQALGFKGILKGQESKSWVFFECVKSQKSFSKRTNKSVDHKFKYFAINRPKLAFRKKNLYITIIMQFF